MLIRIWILCNCSFSKLLNFFSNNRNTSIIRSIQFKDSFSVESWAIKLINNISPELYPKISLAAARIQEVFPVPGGP